MRDAESTMTGVAMALLVGATGLVYSACTQLQAKNVLDAVLTVEQIACVVTRAEIGDSEPAYVQTACGIPADRLRDVANLLTGHQKGMAMAHATRL